MLGAGASTAVAEDPAVPNGTAEALENDEGLYLVFGADLDGEDMSLEEYIESHASGGEVDAEVTQYQDVDQVNINQQGNATSISIDGGEATAVQEASQYNDNEQFADASSDNVQGDETEFENVGDVTVLIGNGDGQQFDGWGVADKKGDKADIGADGDGDGDQEADAVVTQVQEVGQLNYNEQNTAFAIAENESEATALQQSQQENQNLQQGVANATNVYMGNGEFADKTGDHAKSSDSPGADQVATAEVAQGQALDQTNYNEQDGAVAIAVGEGSVATAIQITDQTNLNEQLGVADAANVLTSMEGMNVAIAGAENTDIVDTDTTVEEFGEDKDDKDHHKKSDDEQLQSATSEVSQEQRAEQMNVNLQNTAFAYATNESEATAVQLAHQTNLNAQVGFADALNVYAGPTHMYENAMITETTSVTVGGDDVDGLEGISYDYDAQQTNDPEQHASAQLEQVQFINQENVNEQQAAIAIAENGNSSDSAQVSMQENENIQFGSVSATNVWAGA
ncbi:hypothetical protein AArc1_1399 [Natrarchaeobaculum sulfurireducens]|uniref:Uncharacterized protein n=2 Tax=Natrarchaeobaculum sulfurireducens TaxID=2044521 RepID=A0A346PDY8_9EURY|nr:hypothetical protein [Natrarchaeobaculum sulfurireducens]AXR77733.1 hypothetical protein AArc1_1399 [Natrarchaeobaculum sulfurireducens]